MKNFDVREYIRPVEWEEVTDQGKIVGYVMHTGMGIYTIKKEAPFLELVCPGNVVYMFHPLEEMKRLGKKHYADQVSRCLYVEGLPSPIVAETAEYITLLTTRKVETKNYARNRANLAYLKEKD